MGQRIKHPCIYAEGDFGFNPYKCLKTKCNCKCQFYCNNDKYWRPTYQIKCSDFVSKENENKE